MRAKRLHVLAGIPGCGKSTFAKQLSGVVVSTDEIRELLGDVNDQSRNALVFKAFHNSIDWLLGEQARYPDVIADSTALDARSRRDLVEIADRHGAETHLYLFDNTLEAVMRNTERERVVPQDVMVRMVEKYERTLLVLPQETYTSVTRIGGYR